MPLYWGSFFLGAGVGPIIGDYITLNPASPPTSAILPMPNGSAWLTERKAGANFEWLVDLIDFLDPNHICIQPTW